MNEESIVTPSIEVTFRFHDESSDKWDWIWWMVQAQQLQQQHWQQQQQQQQQEAEMRRGSVASRHSQMSQLSRREKVEGFQRRRSTSIYSDTERVAPDTGSPVYSYDEDHTPVNELNLSVDMNDLTPVATQVIEQSREFKMRI